MRASIFASLLVLLSFFGTPGAGNAHGPAGAFGAGGGSPFGAHPGFAPLVVRRPAPPTLPPTPGLKPLAPGLAPRRDPRGLGLFGRSHDAPLGPGRYVSPPFVGFGHPGPPGMPPKVDEATVLRSESDLEEQIRALVAGRCAGAGGAGASPECVGGDDLQRLDPL